MDGTSYCCFMTIELYNFTPRTYIVLIDKYQILFVELPIEYKSKEFFCLIVVHCFFFNLRVSVVRIYYSRDSLFMIIFCLVFDSALENIKYARKNNVQEEVQSDCEVNYENDCKFPADIVCRQHNIREVCCCQ